MVLWGNMGSYTGQPSTVSLAWNGSRLGTVVPRSNLDEAILLPLPL